MKLIFDIHGTKIKRIDDLTLTSYTRNAKCLFHFSCEWSDVYKYALFIDVNGNQYIRDLGFGRKLKCVAPENVTKGNFFSVSVFGGDRFTTEQENILVQPSGFNDETEGLLASDESEIVSNNTTNVDYHRRWGCWRYMRWNWFEISEHPYL